MKRPTSGRDLDSRNDERETGIPALSVPEHPNRSSLPGAMKRLGPEVFIRMNAYLLNPESAQVVYVNRKLMESLFGTSFSEDQAWEFAERHFLLTLDPKMGIESGAPVEVFVDRQDDPMNMSLNGNLGSGRAVYVGDCFNLKGLGKTKLAVSQDPNHSNGSLDLVSALWEMICANVLNSNLRTGTSPVLAVIDRKRMVGVPWRPGLYPSGVIVRIDRNGELDRPTHLFLRNEPVAAAQIGRFAEKLGRQDAEKFIERILHGCWSAGNVSLDGHLIDYDTVFAVRGRAPQYSYRPNWLSNFFGLEGQGQKKLLKALVNHPINVDRVTSREVNRRFDQARRQCLEERFLDLIGVASNEDEREGSRPMSAPPKLVQQFERLAMKGYPNFRATAPWEEENSGLHVYDLSRFLRFYPILRRAGPVSELTALHLIRNSAGQNILSTASGMPESISRVLTRDFLVGSEGQLQALDRDALAFIQDYDRFLAQISGMRPEVLDQIAMRAYIVNEDRDYLNCRPGNDILVALVQGYTSGKITPRSFSGLLQLLIEAGDRIPQPDAEGRCPADYRIFWNGYTANLVDSEGGYRPSLTILPAFAGKSAPPTPRGDEGQREPIDSEPAGWVEKTWEVIVDGEKQLCSVVQWPHRIRFIGPRLPQVRLLAGGMNPVFLCNGQVFPLLPIARDDQPFGQKEP
jgi:hypothetical protein